LNQILSGQGAIGFVVAMIQFVAAYGAVKAAQPDDSRFDGRFRLQLRGDEMVYAAAAGADAAKEVRQTAFAFFLTVLGVALASLAAYIVLVRLPLYRLVFRAEFDPSADHSRSNKHDPKHGGSGESVVRRTERKVRHLGIAIFLVFCVTLAVFPSITATIVSIRTGLPDAKLLQQPALFVPLGFAVFAGGDWLGRVLPQWEFFQWTNWKGLMACSVARIVFVVSRNLPLYSPRRFRADRNFCSAAALPDLQSVSGRHRSDHHPFRYR
jgi:equilibrative nucleoside transporter 1/2/3